VPGSTPPRPWAQSNILLLPSSVTNDAGVTITPRLNCQTSRASGRVQGDDHGLVAADPRWPCRGRPAGFGVTVLLVRLRRPNCLGRFFSQSNFRSSRRGNASGHRADVHEPVAHQRVALGPGRTRVMSRQNLTFCRCSHLVERSQSQNDDDLVALVVIGGENPPLQRIAGSRRPAGVQSRVPHPATTRRFWRSMVKSPRGAAPARQSSAAACGRQPTQREKRYRPNVSCRHRRVSISSRTGATESTRDRRRTARARPLRAGEGFP
jgi:hypothetical protein